MAQCDVELLGTLDNLRSFSYEVEFRYATLECKTHDHALGLNP
jgi:hypothetical protein